MTGMIDMHTYITPSMTRMNDVHTYNNLNGAHE